MFYGLGRLVVGLRLLITVHHYDIRARICCSLLCLLLDNHIGRHPRLTLDLPHLPHFFGELSYQLILVVHLFQNCSVLLVLLLLMSLFRLIP